MKTIATRSIALFILMLSSISAIYAQNYAEIFITNETKQFLIVELNYEISLDGEKIPIDLSQNGYIYLQVDPGLHVLEIRVFDSKLKKSHSVRLNAGEKSWISINGTIFSPLEISDISTSKHKKYDKKVYKNKLLCLGEYRFNKQTTTNSTFVSASNSSTKSDVDINIPDISTSKNKNTYALIITNEDYTFLDDVKYASNDGEIFKQYCIKTLGIPAEQIRLSQNASFGILNSDIAWLKEALNLQAGNNAIVYYCGHGIPDEKTSDAYLVPTDSDGKNSISCYSLKKLYSTLSNTKASRITYFMDACFTGASREGDMLIAARGIAREAKKEVLEGNSIVFAATSSDETAMTHKSQNHGLFTYYLLKKLQETKGNVTYSELAEYITSNVKKQSLLINNKPQTPTISTSPDFSDSWRNAKLK